MSADFVRANIFAFHAGGEVSAAQRGEVNYSPAQRLPA